MADKIMSLKVAQSNGSFGNEIPLGANASNVEVTLASGSTASLTDVLGSSKTGGGAWKVV